MQDNEESDNEYFIQDVEDIAWRGLRKQGLSDDEIWKKIDEACDYDFRRIREFTSIEILAYLLLEVHVLYEEFDDSSLSMTHVEWAAKGYWIGYLLCAVLDQHVKENISKQNAEAARKKRKVGKTVYVDWSIDSILGGSVNSKKTMHSVRGGDLAAFRYFVGESITLDDLDTAITLQEGVTDAETNYIFENLRTGERTPVTYDALRKKISRRARRLRAQASLADS